MEFLKAKKKGVALEFSGRALVLLLRPWVLFLAHKTSTTTSLKHRAEYWDLLHFDLKIDTQWCVSSEGDEDLPGRIVLTQWFDKNH